MFKRFFALFATVLAITFAATAQIMTPVTWTSEMTMTGDDKGKIVLTANIQDGWHMYAMDLPDGGPQSLEFTFPKLDGVKLEGKPTPSKAAHRQMDEMFGMELAWWTQSVTITQNFTATKPEFAIDMMLVYGACNDENCIPPSRETFSFTGKAKVKAAAEPVEEKKAEEAAPAEEVAAETATDEAATDSVAAPVVADTKADSDLWTPVNYEDAGESAPISAGSFWYIFFTCFLGGLVALFTPCVWPMIPMTVSFFLKKGKDRSKSIKDACIYGISIIVIYVALGLIITAIFGASKLNELSTSATFNIIFFLLLVVFAISFFGAFDIKLPASWSNRMDASAERTSGMLSIFFMAFTLTLVSFSCTGPIIGTLLVEAASMGNMWGPAIGMLGFSMALALPFMLFAMFPTMLQAAPSSGNWMNTLKVVLGFVELALSLKFLSVADLAYGWHILDREIFLALWIVMFALLGLYLLGKFNFAHYGPADSSIGVFRFFLAMISLSMSVYLIPGLWGAPLKGVSAFVPPLYTQDFNLYGESFKEYDDYEEGMKVAAQEGKPVLIDFSGYGCVNCRKMEGAVLDDPNVKNMITDNFVVIKLMVDEKANLPEPIKVTEYGKEITLYTYGDKWSYLQRYKFNANAQPYYVVLDEKGSLLSGPFSYEEDIPKFTNFLEKGIKSFAK
ncbi:cytochrome c biogenesis protein CcdA [uncultured Duncaniella sp.]|uniref:protein-disulfide reductase DsbD family protein n=1 Tax=uncultured Duncaniella sp. TaxID=2768039 RepID=UPI002677487D|nr:cytochrome c biogenesis protein CcdA [uncultured Duncaniella sp.]MCI9173196.1 thioredoxin fold domain-containing protein [Muribaculaceae bacterium]